MALLKKSFIILAAIVNNILYINKPQGVKNVAVCFLNCENRSEFMLMSEKLVNNGNLAVYYTELPANISTYKLKLVFPDNTEGDVESSSSSSSLSSTCPIEEYIIKDYIRKIFILACFTVLSLLVLIFKIIVKYLKNRRSGVTFFNRIRKPERCNNDE